MVQALPTDHAWAAGVIDSDGCITIKRRTVGDAVYYALFLVVGLSAREGTPTVLTRLHELYGGTLSSNDSPRPAFPNSLPRYQWQVATRQAETTLRLVEPYLVGKRDQAAIALEYREQAMGRGKGELAAEFYTRLRDTKNYTFA